MKGKVYCTFACARK